MDHDDHVRLLRDAVRAGQGNWADLGSGSGAFTLALADILGPSGRIVSVDRDGGALREQERAMRQQFPDVPLEVRQADFTGNLELPALDGLLMANSLHFVRDKPPVLRRLLRSVRPGGRFVLVEYDADHGNPWVPYPVSFETWRAIAADLGLEGTRLAGRVPSRFLGAIYSAVSIAPPVGPASAGE
jgi:ubiquinone/menaquinone biosynthesis C-methylase UbiE